MKRITKVALGGVASCALILGGAQVASGALVDNPQESTEDSNDLNTLTVALDSAKAKITIAKGTNGEGRKSTTFTVRMTELIPNHFASPDTGLSPSHGQCMEDDVGTPYRRQPDRTTTTTCVTARSSKCHGQRSRSQRETEVWFDLVPNAEGMAYDETTVPFVPDDSFRRPKDSGVMSVVVHDAPTKPDHWHSWYRGKRASRCRVLSGFRQPATESGWLRQTQPLQQHPVLPGGKAPGSDRPGQVRPLCRLARSRQPTADRFGCSLPESR